MSKILYVVESPFQLLSAMEAKNHFPEYESILLIRYFPERISSVNNTQIKNMLSLSDWSYIEVIKSNLSTKISNYKLFFNIQKIQKKYNVFDKIFIGEYRSWVHRKYLEILNPQESFLLDDGSVSIDIQKNYLPTYKDYTEKNNYKSYFDTLLQKFIFKIFNIKEKKITINLFTCFDLEAYSTQQKVIKHKFEFAKKMINMKNRLNNKVYFLGSPLSETNLISEKYELDILSKIIQRFNENNIELIYVPHRREKKNKLDKIINNLNTKLKRFTYPAEIEFILMEDIPWQIASFYSTTLISIPRIIDFHEVISFQLDYKEMNSDNLEVIKDTYNFYSKNLHIVDLNDY